MSRRANKFLVWRVGQSVDWDCTAADIASEVGLTPEYVGVLCNSLKASPLGEVRRQSPSERRPSLDRVFAGRLSNGQSQ